MSMPRLTAILVLIGLGLLTYAAYAGSGSPRSLPPVIQSTTADFNNNVMVITGRNFGSAPPIVRLANHVLKVESFSANEVVVNLPRGIRPATYSLTVTASGSHKVSSDIFITALMGYDRHD